MSQDQIGKARAMEAARYGVSGNKHGTLAAAWLARAISKRLPERAAGARASSEHGTRAGAQ